MNFLENIDYNNCITNVTSSIQKHFKMQPNYNTNPIIDRLLEEKDYENIIIFVFDGMGNSIIDKNTTEKHFLQTHRISKMRSTYPSTTANCTTAYISGLNPISNGWLGWSTYFPMYNQVIDNFPNCDTLSKEVIPGEKIAYNVLSYKPLGKQIEEATNNEVKYYEVYPKFMPNGCISLKHFASRICKICEQKGKKYIYAYWDNPDGLMHIYGTKNEVVRKTLNDISKALHYIERKTKNTIGIVSADHGHIDVTPIALYTYLDVVSCLRLPFSCDGRTAFFFVKNGLEEDFKKVFNHHFSTMFDLYTKQEVLDNHIFGYGEEHPLIQQIVGDYVAIAKDRYYFVQDPRGHFFKGHHAGILNEETDIPIIIIKN